MEPIPLVVKWPDAPAKFIDQDDYLFDVAAFNSRTPGGILKGI
jgi:hypothetical protein